MKKAVLGFLLCAAISLNAQTTHHLDWFMNITPAQASLTIEEGDTVEWTFTDAAPHSVTNDAGSTETFDSGILSTGVGTTYSFTFTTSGTNPYHCNVHGGMVGTITVEPLGIDERNVRNFSIGPNPASSELFIELPNQPENLRVEVYDLLGKLILQQEIETTQTSIDISGWGKGVYMVTLTDGNSIETKRFIKR